MGKLQKRKGNGAVAFEKGTSPICYAPSLVNKDMKIYCIDAFVKSLNQYATLNEQGKSCQMFRGVIQSHCTTLDAVKDKLHIQQLCITLLDLYLTPVIFPIRKILEWIVDIVLRKRCMGLIDSNELQACVKLVFFDIKRRFDVAMASDTVRSDAYYMEWVMTFNTFVSLERESPWMYKEPVEHISATISTVNSSYGLLLSESVKQSIFGDNFYSLLHYDGLIIKKLSGIVLAKEHNDPGGMPVSLLACFEESVRLIASAVKCKKAEILNSSLVFDEECSVFETDTLKELDIISKLPYVTQNVVNGITLCMASISWIHNATYGDSQAMDLLLIRSLHNCSNDSSLPLSERTSNDFSCVKDYSQLIGKIVNQSSGLNGVQMELCYAYYRAHISIMEDSTLFHTFSLQQTEARSLLNGIRTDNEISHSLVHFDDVLHLLFNQMCSNASNSLCFLALQIFETLCSRLSSVLLTAHPDVCLLFAAWNRNLNTMSRALTTQWTSASKPINHIVPSLYERMIQISIMCLPNLEDSTGLEAMWHALITQALAQPTNYRGRYQALTLLFNKIPKDVLLKLLFSNENHGSSNIITVLINAVKHRDISSASCSCLCSLLQRLKPVKEKTMDANEFEELLMAFRDLWVNQLVDALCGITTGTADESTVNSIVVNEASAQQDRASRINIAEYLVPELTRVVDDGCVGCIVNMIRRKGDAISVQRQLWALCHVVLHARQLGLVGGEVVYEETHSLGNGTTTSSSIAYISVNIAPTGPLRASELKHALVCDDIDLKLIACTLLVASPRTVTPFPEEDLGLIRYAFPYIIKCPLQDHRHKVCRIMKTCMLRMKECTRVCTRDSLSLRTKMLKIYGSDEDKTKPEFIEIEKMNDTVRSNVAFCSWISNEIVGLLQPGCTFDRSMMLIDIISCIVETLQMVSVQHQQVLLQHQQQMSTPSFKCLTGANASSIEATLNSYATSEVLLECFYTTDMVTTILRCCESTWDRCRQAASELILLFPAPLPGIDATPIENAPHKLDQITQRGYKFANSVRQRESEAGSLILRNIFHIYVMKLGWNLSLSNPSTVVNDNKLSSSSIAQDKPLYNHSCTVFLNELCDHLDGRLNTLQSLYHYILNQGSIMKTSLAITSSDTGVDLDANETPTVDWSAKEYMCHGIIWTIMHCVDQIVDLDCMNINRMQQSGIENCKDLMREWRELIVRLYSIMVKAFNTAMLIVAEASVDTYFAPLPTAGADVGSECVNEDAAVAKGPVHANSFMFVNTNGFVGAADGEDSDDEMDGGSGSDKKNWATMIIQKAVVSAWLLSKASVALLTHLVEILPSINNSINENTAQEHILLNVEFNLGGMLIDALGRLRHLGALVEVQVSLQKLCELILSKKINTTNSPVVQQLPGTWIQRQLTRLHNEEQVFILRRSAGFAYSFLSVLRAEGPTVSRNTDIDAAGASSSLLQHTMSALLRIAREDLISDQSIVTVVETAAKVKSEEQTKWRRCVHAINILRLILLDGTLTSGTDGFLSQCGKLAISGFRSGQWGIRNSCMMLFTAVIQKSIDNEKNDRKNILARRTATVQGYFHKFPDLFPFMCTELDYATHKVEGASDTDIKRRTQALYPILLLFSKLKPSLRSSPLFEGSSVDISVFVPMIEKCYDSLEIKTRNAAASALAAIIPVESIPVKIQELCEQYIPFKCQSANELHGVLLTILSLCESLCKHNLHFMQKYVYKAVSTSTASQHDENTKLLIEVGLSMEQLAVPTYMLFLDHVIKFQHDYAVVPPALTLTYLKTLNCFKILGYEFVPRVGEGESAYIGSPVSCRNTFYNYCYKHIVRMHQLFIAQRTEHNATILGAVPVLPLTFQSILEYFISSQLMCHSDRKCFLHGMPIEQQSASYSELVSLILELCFAPTSTETFNGFNLIEIQMGVLIGTHLALDMHNYHSASKDTVTFIKGLVTGFIAIFEASLNSNSGGFVETVTEIVLTLLCRLFRRQNLRVLFQEVVLEKFEIMWKYFSSLLSVESNVKANASEKALLPSSCAAYSLELLGWMIYVKTYENDVIVSTVKEETIQQLHLLCEYIKLASRQTETISMRLFCARALLYSNMMHTLTYLAHYTSFPAVHSMLFQVGTAILYLLQDDDEDVRLVASKIAGRIPCDLAGLNRLEAAVPLSVDMHPTIVVASEEEELVCSHRFMSYIQATIVPDEMVQSQVVQPTELMVGSSTEQATVVVSKQLHITQECVLERMSLPLAQALTNALVTSTTLPDANTTTGTHLLKDWLLLWDTLIGTSAAHMKQPIIAYAMQKRLTNLNNEKEGGTSHNTLSTKIFTEEPINTYFEKVTTAVMWVDVMMCTIENVIQSLNVNAIDALVVFIESLVPELDNSVNLLDSLLHIGSNNDSELLLENILSNDDIFAYLYCQILFIHRLDTCDRDNATPLTNTIKSCIEKMHKIHDSVSYRDLLQIHPNLRNIVEIYKQN